MFQPLGPKSITVCFNTLDLAEQATREWDKNVCNIVNLGKGQSVPTKAKSKKAKSPGKAKGFMKAIEEVSEDDPQPSLLCGVLPPATECCIGERTIYFLPFRPCSMYIVLMTSLRSLHTSREPFTRQHG